MIVVVDVVVNQTKGTRTTLQAFVLMGWKERPQRTRKRSGSNNWPKSRTSQKTLQARSCHATPLSRVCTVATCPRRSRSTKSAAFSVTLWSHPDESVLLSVARSFVSSLIPTPLLSSTLLVALYIEIIINFIERQEKEKEEKMVEKVRR